MNEYSIFGTWFLDWLNNPPDAKNGFYCKSSQKKRRKNQRRTGKRGRR